MDNHLGSSSPERRRRPRSAGWERVWHPFYELLRWIEGHVRGFYAAVGLFLTLGLALALLALLVFIGVAELVRAGATRSVDENILLWLDSRGEPWLDVLALEITALGAGAVVVMTVIVASTFLWISEHRYSAVLLWIAMVGGGVLNLALKAFYDRPRPMLFEWRAPHVGGLSFPSGHSMTAVVVYGTLAYLVARLESTRRMRRFTLGMFVVVILLIGLSRMYLGVHYPSDVVAGFLAGVAWATVCALGIEAVRYFRTRNPEADRYERDLDRSVDPVREAVERESRPASAGRAEPGSGGRGGQRSAGG